MHYYYHLYIILYVNYYAYSCRPDYSLIIGLFLLYPLGHPITTQYDTTGNKANSAVMQVFELKLMLYLPLLKNMPPGIFLSSSDTIELYSLDDDSVVNFSNGNITHQGILVSLLIFIQTLIT